MTSGVNHITFAVSDLQRSVAFYVDVVGCVKVATWLRGAYLRAGNMWLCLSPDPVAATPRVRDYTHVAFTFAPADLAAFRARLLAAGGVEWKVDSSEGDSVYFLDPDGHRLEAHVGDLESRLTSLQEAPYEGLKLFDVGEWPELRTGRLLLRGWTPEDRVALAAINSDPRVMEFIGDPLTREQSDAFADSVEARFARHGFGFWAVEVPGIAPFVGFVGLNVPDFDAPFMPAVEVGWRLGADFWGRGYASEAARAALDFGFTVAGLDEIVAFTTARNVRSRRVMERIGMTHDPRDDFDHPLLPADSPFRPHVLYRASRSGAARHAGERIERASAAGRDRT